MSNILSLQTKDRQAKNIVADNQSFTIVNLLKKADISNR